MKRTVQIIAAVTLAMFPFVSIAAELCTDPVDTEQGAVKGVAEKESASCAWKGIPYAAPPVGEMRWRAPGPPIERASVLDVSQFGPACMQHESFTSGGKSPTGISEDCLTLNIWRPQKSGKFPVMYWIHGGGLTVGASNYEMYDGARLAAEEDVVVVTVNYRLDVFGFMAHPDAADEDPEGSAGNYGLMDQIQGLKWVRDNIEEFGGDADRVTIFGESAGGLSVCNLLASPPASGLFHRAVIQSGGCDLTRPLEKGFEKGKELAEDVGCEGPDALECMRDLPSELLLAADLGFSSSYVDGHIIPDVPIKLIRDGDYNQVPVMVGNTRDEINLFLVPMGILTMPGFVVKALQKKALGEERYEELNKMYTRKEFGRPAKRVLTMSSEAFGSRGFQAAEAISVTQPVYYYSFDWDEYFGGSVMGAFHGLEIPFVFGNVRLERDSMKLVFRNDKIEERARPISDDMMAYWANFARTGDPNGEGLTKWPEYNTDSRMRIHFDTKITTESIPSEQLKRYQYWASQDIGMGDIEL